MKKSFFVVACFLLLIGLVMGAEAPTPTPTPTPAPTQSSGDVWKDPTSGLTWQVLPTGGTMGWKAAKAHCKKLRLGGYSDWRLPTISELRSLIKGCPATQTGGSCGVTDSCLSYSCRNSACNGCSGGGGPGSGGAYWPPELSDAATRWYWSSSAAADSSGPAWGVYCSEGGVNVYFHGGGGNILGARCVR